MANPHDQAMFVGSNRGTPDLRVGTTPGTAGAASMSGGAAQGEMPFGPFAPRRTVNQTVGKLTNHSIPQWNLIRRFRSGAEKYIQKGQLVFIETKMPQSFDHAKLDTMFNLPTLNYFLAKMSAAWTNDPSAERTANYLADTYVPFGVVLNTSGESRDVGAERMVNSTVRGEADTFNLWSNDMQDGDKLWLLYKQVRVYEDIDPFHYNLDFEQNSRNGLAAHNGKAQVSLVWQVVPFVERSGKKVNWDTELNNGANLGDDPDPADSVLNPPKPGVARYVGRVQHVRRWGNPSGPSSECTRSVSKMVNLPQLTIFLDL